MREFEIIPAIDVLGGRLARMRAGDPSDIEELPGDPFDLARRFAESGARWLHVVDLDAAVSGNPANLDLLARIAELPIHVQAGGSLSPDGADASLAHGADRAVLGAAILAEPTELAAAVARHGGRVGVALDVRDGVVAPRGAGRTGPDLDEAIRVVSLARPAFVTYTEVASDGLDRGPALESLSRMTRRLRVPVFASGGVRSIEDLDALSKVEPPLAGAIVGRALQEGRFTVGEAQVGLGQRAPVVLAPGTVPGTEEPPGPARLTGSRAPAVLLILGGAITVLGSLLPWVRVSTDRASTTVAGVSSWQGVVALICGVGLVLLGIAVARGAKPSRGRAMAAVVFGVVAAGVAIHVIGTQDAQIDEGIRKHLRAGGAVSEAEVRRAHAALLEAGLKVTLLPGLFGSLAGSLTAMAGGAIAVGAGSEKAPTYSGRP